MKEVPAAMDGTAADRKAERGLTVVRTGRWLLAHFADLHDVLSWAIVGGGARQASTVAWRQVDRGDLTPPVDAREFLRAKLLERSLPDAVGLMTGRNLDAYEDVERRHGDVSARCLATVGLSNALRVGDPPGAADQIGTINLLCRVSTPLTEEALVEALALAAEARTLALIERSVASRASELPASGTGTDCLVVAAPRSGTRMIYAGKHTAVGHVIGATVYEAVRHGAQAWLREHPETRRIRD